MWRGVTCSRAENTCSCKAVRRRSGQLHSDIIAELLPHIAEEQSRLVVQTKAGPAAADNVLPKHCSKDFGRGCTLKKKGNKIGTAYRSVYRRTYVDDPDH